MVTGYPRGGTETLKRGPGKPSLRTAGFNHDNGSKPTKLVKLLMKAGSLWRTFKAIWKPTKWPTWAQLLMLSMSPPLSTFDGRQWPRQSETSGFWSDRSSETVRRPGLE
eukprot:6949-Amphidinium_carterae.1